MTSNDSVRAALCRNLGRRCTIFTDSGDSFTGILSDVSNNSCTLISTSNSRCPAAQRVNTIPIDKISCLSTSQL